MNKHIDFKVDFLLSLLFTFMSVFRHTYISLDLCISYFILYFALIMITEIAIGVVCYIINRPNGNRGGRRKWEL